MSPPQTFTPKDRDRLADVAGSGCSAIEQHIDFLTGRPFRNSVLLRQRQMSSVSQWARASERDGVLS
jgi:methyltransferase-like protein